MPRQVPAAELAAELAPVLPMPGQAGPPPGQYPVPGATTPTRYTPGVGVWVDQRQVLDWCPVVTRHLVTYSPRGEVTARRVTLDVAGHTATVSTRDVADGSVWPDRFPTAAGVAGRTIRDTLTNIIDHQARSLPLTPMYPRWEGGRLVLPPTDVMLSAGYGVTAGTVAEYRAVLRAAAESPRIALVAGMAAGGVYVAPLGGQSYTAHLAQASSVGKSTTLAVAAGIFGDPASVVRTWNATGNGAGAKLRELATLTAFRDELHTAGFRPADLEKTIFQFMEGATRDAATRTGGAREDQSPWHGVLISAGNVPIIERVPNGGIAARVVEFHSPMTNSPEHSRRLKPAARRCYGHGLAAIVESGPTPEAFAELAAAALAELAPPDGGIGERVAEHIAAGIAGARVLADLFGVPELAEAAAEGGRETLAAQLDHLADTGTDYADRLLQAVAGTWAADPGAFPTRTAYARMVAEYEAGTRFGAPRVLGWNLADDTLPGDLAVLQAKLPAIAEAAGMDSVGVALRGLRERGQLLTVDTRNLARLVKVGGKPFRAYVFGGVLPTEAEAAEVEPSGPVTTGTTGPVTTPVTAPVTTSDQGGNDGNDISRRQTYKGGGGCQVCRVPGPSCGIDYVTEHPAPCVCCGREVWGVTRCGARREHVCHGPERAEIGPRVAGTTPAAPIGPQRPAQAAAGQVPAAADPAELADWRRAVAKLTEGDTTPPAEPMVADALAAWHTATGGLRWVGWAGDTATAALAWIDGKRGAVARGEAAAAVELAELADLAADVVLHLDYVTEAATPEVGQAVTALDVNGQYLAAAAIPLGTGAPVHLPAPGTVAPFVKAPGYVRLAEPIDWPHPALRGRLTAGAVLAMPYVDYLTRRGAEVVPAEVWTWPTGQHRPHLAAWQKVFRTAYNTLRTTEGPAARLALRMVKHTYTVFLGGWLRSDRNTTRTCRRDWSDHIIAESWVRAMVAVGKAEAAGGVVLGMRRDSAWFLADTAPIEPAGLTVSGQLGKWKVDRWAEVDATIIDAHGTGSADLLNKAIKAAHESREG